MRSRSTEIKQAPWKIDPPESVVNAFSEIREDIVTLYARAYMTNDEVRRRLGPLSNRDLRWWARETSQFAAEYDPHDSIHSIFRQLDHYRRAVSFVLATIVLITVNLGWAAAIAVGLFRGWSLLSSWLLPIEVLAFLVVYRVILEMDTYLTRQLNDELRTDLPELMTRRRSEIVAYGVWNQSLASQKIVLLMGLLHFLKTLPHVPLLGRAFDNPYRYVIEQANDNMDVFAHEDTKSSMFRTIYRRLRLEIKST